MTKPLASSVSIEPMRPGHWPAVQLIHEAGILGGNATIERVPAPDWSTWNEAHRPDCRLVAVEVERVLGWVALSPYSSRQAYSGVAWLSVYVATDMHGRGIGGALLGAVVEAAEEAGIWSLLAGILVENVASLAVHRAAGFRRVGVQERIGRDRTGRWRDVVLMERRSSTQGIG
ncbi:MAG: GNAT family N-acetyltransferase [Candidatus Limnocylindrales bacterium]